MQNFPFPIRNASNRIYPRAKNTGIAPGIPFQGSEIVGLDAAETQNPEKTGPKACGPVKLVPGQFVCDFPFF